MEWLPFAAGGALALATADVSIKLASGRISGQVGAVLYSLAGLPVMAGWLVAARAGGSTLRVTPAGVLAALAAGVAFALVVIFLYETFATGADISVAVPLIRVSGILVASAAGIVLLGEPLTGRYLVGLALTSVGVYLVAAR